MIYHGTITMENGAELPFELYPEDAPRTVENFVKLVKEGYYDGKTFHRVIKNFVSQGGCPYGTGAGDLGYTIPCETANNPHKHEDGSLSMAHRGYRLLSVLYLPLSAAASGWGTYRIRQGDRQSGRCTQYAQRRCYEKSGHRGSIKWMMSNDWEHRC